MPDETILSELCSVCHVTKFKYRCPGCNARTCSLVCYKRHQQWAQCDGKRDPTKYVKKSQLMTPAGIDHDFNFLTSIERGVEKAERNLDQKGLGSASSDPQRVVLRRLNDNQYASAGVTVIRAPSGLSRNKENNTHFSNKKNIIWTVEWIQPHKSRSLCELSGRLTVQEAYKTSNPKGKRKRPVQATSASDQSQPAKRNQHVSTFHVGQDERVRPIPDSQKEVINSSGRRSSIDSHTAGHRPSEQESTAESELAENARSSPDLNGSDSESVSTEHHFFLLKPRTSSSRSILIPVQSTSTINDCLRGRTVLEFPTFYVFKGSSLQLPDEFMLEEEYLKQEQEEQKEFDEMMGKVNPSALRAIRGQTSAYETPDEEVDSARILDVLKRDLGTSL